MYDLLVKNGRVIDPAQKLDNKFDIGISRGKIAKVSKDISAKESNQVIDAEGKIVTPGLIDVHCHVYDVLKAFPNGPDGVGVYQGVTTAVDAGSAGEALFSGFPKYIIPSSLTRVFCFVFLGSQGLCTFPPMRDRIDLNPNATTAAIEANRQIVKGIKVGLSGPIVENEGAEVVKIAKGITKQFGLPIMVHIGDPAKKVSAKLTQDVLRLMEKGDILSHVFTGMCGRVISQDGMVLPELKEALAEGVVLDVAAGIPANFSFGVARKCLSQGIFPTTISSDCAFLPDLGLTAIMSIFLELGLKLEQIVEMCTINPACAIQAEDMIGSLKLGMDADVSILELVSGSWEIEDCEQETLKVTKAIVPRACIRSGRLINITPNPAHVLTTSHF